ncbi:hypothetical protein TWF718_000407 [Orbilia javanica]|uniref:chitinase n=1 Tax=Orbilia javanica TaxID=47235 RepID=A0AAN8MX41_9PEZI
MATLSWLTVALGAVILMPGAVSFVPPVGTALQRVEFCPERCAVSGPNTGNWSVYPNFKTIKRCQQTIFYDFSVYDPVDDPDTNHRIRACSSFSVDSDSVPSQPAAVKALESASSVDVEFELGWWREGHGFEKATIRSLLGQVRDHIDNSHQVSDRPFIMYGQSGQAAIGVYIGQGLLHQGLTASALRVFQDNLSTLDVTTPSLAMQLCGSEYDSTHIFGVMVTSNATFAPIQNAIKSWDNAICQSFPESKKIPGKASFTTPLLNVTPADSTVFDMHIKSLQPRANCRTVQVRSGEGCAQLAARCGISGAAFTKYNPRICNSLQPKQYVCCSSGSLPDLRPKPKSDGSCFPYKIRPNDSCGGLGARYGLKIEQIKSFNKNTWGWSGCNPLFVGTIICLSTGRPPFPAPIPNAVCGPQKPGSTPPPAGTNIAYLNPCPLNACCNIWGQCGVTKDFCVDTNTGAPGTARPGTYGCISNCGVDIIQGTGTGAMKVGYFQGYGMSRKCLHQDALQIDTSKYTHIHFGFGTLTPSYEVRVGDKVSSNQFNQFKRLKNVKKILSFGGWEFSTSPKTYKIFREGVKEKNRLVMATKIANFVKEHKLDGVDIDWEHPGAPDLPAFDPGKAEDGPNYLRFLAVLKKLLPGKTVSIAAPASYWYLKQFPIKGISMIVDYIVYMTYDFNGQWGLQEGCDTGNCLRSHVNLTDTRQALTMITKAGVPGNKIVVGLASYGRSFKMAKPGCWGPNCKFTGTRQKSGATPGRCTGTAGYLANAEINEIIRSGDPKRRSRVVTHFLDAGSNSDILVYDNNQWVGYMSQNTKKLRSRIYTRWGMAGTSDWATDLQEFHDPPGLTKSPSSFVAPAARGAHQKKDTINTGDWRKFDCTHTAISDLYDHPPSQRWKMLDADSAWQEVVTKWLQTDRQSGITFLDSVSQTLKMGSGRNCGAMNGKYDTCDAILKCEDSLDGPFSGPAAMLIWESLREVHGVYHFYWETLDEVKGDIESRMRYIESVFAPTSVPKSDQWFNILIDIFNTGGLTTTAPFFDRVLKRHPTFSHPTAFDNAKHTALNLIGQFTMLEKDAVAAPKPGEWTPKEQDKFSDYIGQAIAGWMNHTELTLRKLFNGAEEAVGVLGEFIADGKFIEGGRKKGSLREDSLRYQLQPNAVKSFAALYIPALWRASQVHTFVIDSGAGCDGEPVSKYLDDYTANKTAVCYEGRRYYLVYPEGEARPCTCKRVTDLGPCQAVCQDGNFSAPVGLDNLGSFGQLTKEDIVIGSVRTWLHNGKTNGGSGLGLVNDASVWNGLFDADITTPGVIRLPVCSPERAFRSWRTSSKGSSGNFPCDTLLGKDLCSASTFEDKTSGASPLVSDCLQIIANIEGNPSSKWTQRNTGQRKIVKYGSCAFSIEQAGDTLEFEVGGQDVIGIINDAIDKFGSNGKVGAKGVMSCGGTTAGTHVNVLWELH